MKHEILALREGRGDVSLTTYVLDDSTEMLGGKKRPAVLVCPGGGYMFCSDREAEPIALRFNAMGYHAFVLRYSVLGRGKSLGFLPEATEADRETMHPAPVLDAAFAMRVIADNADPWLVDADRIALCGFSAGAHNAAMYGAYWNAPLVRDGLAVYPAPLSLSPRNPERRAPVKPAALVLSYGMYDYPRFDTPAGGDLATLRQAANLALMGAKLPSPEVLRAMSPALRLSADFPPAFVWATRGDDLVPVQQSCYLAAALAEAGLPFEAHIFENGPHGLALADQSTAGTRMETLPAAARWIELADAWLKTRFALPLEEKPAWMRK